MFKDDLSLAYNNFLPTAMLTILQYGIAGANWQLLQLRPDDQLVLLFVQTNFIL
jgi:hypothetical protein